MNAEEIGNALKALLAYVPSLGSRHLFEMAALLNGIKRTVRIVLEPSELAYMTATLERLKLHWGLAPFGLATSRSTNLGDCWTFPVEHNDPRLESLVVYAALDSPTTLELAFQYETEGSGELGALLGYPPCCITVYEEKFSEGVDWVALLLEDRKSLCRAKGPAPWAANKLAYLFDGLSLLPDYFPCSLYCAGAASIGLAYRDCARSCGLEDLVEQAEQAMARPIVVWQGCMLQPIQYQTHGSERLVFDGASALRFEWRALAPQDHHRLDQAGGCQAGRDGLTLLDCHGQPMAKSSDGSGALLQFSGGH
jgi:hypothetical protein